MFVIEGKYAKAKIFQDPEFVETSCIEQIKTIVDSKAVEGSDISIMPDAHTGSSVCIGFTQTFIDRVVPNFVGVDIGCGMLVTRFSGPATKKYFGTQKSLENLDKLVRERIPLGMTGRTTKHRYAEDFNWLKDLRAKGIDIEQELLKISTIGGGNHFIEVDVDEIGDYYLVIHTGSRHLGVAVANYYQKLAAKNCNNSSYDKKLLIEKLKSEGRQSEIQEELLKLKVEKIPDDLCYLEGQDLKDYLHDMEIVQLYAEINRLAVAEEICRGLGIEDKIIDTFSTIHNYIDVVDKVVRKGAISLKAHEKAIIPLNMRDGSLIVVGKGNTEWNMSGPHGAGRLMSRTQAKQTLSLKDFEDQMKNVFSTSVGPQTLDESPNAYKPVESIIQNIGQTCDIVKRIKPVWNLKAGE